MNSTTDTAAASHSFHAPPLDRPIRLAVLISGGGTTMLNFLDKIRSGELNAEIVLVIASREGIAGIERASAAGLPCKVIARKQFGSVEAFSETIFDCCRAAKVDLVTLAGFLSLIHIPPDYQHRVLNIHPSLIPAFCGHGFHGHHVHEAVLDRGAKISGCTVHFADNEYDHGPIVVQRAVNVLEGDTADSLAARVFAAECEAYPEAIRLFAEGRLTITGGRLKIQ
jgi:formyltetrahydrofolate-dependent phosphoribosylglycinamide formyltransferase